MILSIARAVNNFDPVFGIIKALSHGVKVLSKINAPNALFLVHVTLVGEKQTKQNNLFFSCSAI